MSRDLPLFDLPGEFEPAPAQAPAPMADVAPPPAPAEPDLPDADARRSAVDPLENVVLEASAGTGKTRVLVDRYLNLLRAGVEPQRILAITFTRKAATEMRERILRSVQQDPALWTALRDRLGEVAITTIDAFCLALLREFPLEAGLDPAFDVADETEVPRLIDEALDSTMRIGQLQADRDPEMALVLAQLGAGRTRDGLARLLERRLIADEAMERFLERSASGPMTLDQLSARAVASLRTICSRLPGWPDAFIATGPVKYPGWPMIARQLRGLDTVNPADHAAARRAIDAARKYFLKSDGGTVTNTPTAPLQKKQFAVEADQKRHHLAVKGITEDIRRLVEQHNAALNIMLTRGVRAFYRIALDRYRRALDERSALDFSELLARALSLFRDMDDFARSRYLLEQRYQHVLVDEFQDTSRAQWELIAELVKAWGEGAGLAQDAGPIPPSIFIVGDRKQSIYRFRDADVTVLDRAAEFIGRLRAGGTKRRAIVTSMRAVPALQSFINDLFGEIDKSDIRTAFTYGDTDRFPIATGDQTRVVHDGRPIVGIVADDSPEETAARIAEEIVRLLTGGAVRDRDTGVARRPLPGDIAILFRTRASHKEIEAALESRGVPTYVYKGLGFFDSDEVRDLLAMLRFLAQPESEARAAALLRSRFFRISDGALQTLSGRLAPALAWSEGRPDALDTLDAGDRAILDAAGRTVQRWLGLVDRLPPAEVLDGILDETAYLYEIAGPRARQARENVKKFRSMIRRIQNRGYSTLSRIASHVDRLYAGDESNAAIEAIDAVNLMTAHASKGLEFPIVFVVSLTKSSGGMAPPVRVVLDDDEGERVWVGPFASDDDKTGEKKRETEETKRLLYVALTRARDRLYLGTVLKEGKSVAGNGSLAKVMPSAFLPLFEAAGRGETDVAWTRGERTYPFRVCPPPEAVPLSLPRQAASEAPAAEFTPLTVDVRLMTAAVTAAASERPAAESHAFVPLADRLLGTLVHRMLQRGVDPGDLDRIAVHARALALDDELAAVEDASAAIAEAAATFQAIAARDDVRALLASGECLHELPFSLRREGQLLRGTIDCLVLRPDSSALVIEFKTGRKRPEHQVQLDVYVEAARMLLPGADVSGVLVYP
ncbi:MAG: UvrD-helicase domain-containing protein [Acidobacteriota bacterium]|nr:UvrD-helicase domain-containing protein [Acidobacteriota bacterium]